MLAVLTQMLLAHEYLVLAHNGGADEIAFVVLPILIFGGLLLLANHRAKKQLAEREDAAPTPE